MAEKLDPKVTVTIEELAISRMSEIAALQPLRLLSLLLVTSFIFGGCDAERSRLMKENYPSYPENIKRAIDRHYPLHGMDHDQVFLALGEPICKKTIQDQAKPVEVWLYPPGGRNPCKMAEFRVYFENGAVSGWQTVRVESEGG